MTSNRVEQKAFRLPRNVVIIRPEAEDGEIKIQTTRDKILPH
jgi:hypothetical protein